MHRLLRRTLVQLGSDAALTKPRMKHITPKSEKRIVLTKIENVQYLMIENPLRFFWNFRLRAPIYGLCAIKLTI